MKLNKTQLEFARAKLNAAAVAKTKALVEKKLGDKPEVPKLSFAEKVKLIGAGQAKLLPVHKLYKHTNLEDAFEYPTLDKQHAAAKAKFDAWEAKRVAIAAAVETERSALEAKLVLSSDADEVLALLEAFSR